MLFANACGPLDSRIPGLGALLRGRFAAASRVVDGWVTMADADGEREQLVMAGVTPGASEPDDRVFSRRWSEPFSTRAQLCWLDSLTGWLARPVYVVRRRRLRDRAAE